MQPVCVLLLGLLARIRLFASYPHASLCVHSSGLLRADHTYPQYIQQAVHTAVRHNFFGKSESGLYAAPGAGLAVLEAACTCYNCATPVSSACAPFATEQSGKSAACGECKSDLQVISHNYVASLELSQPTRTGQGFSGTSNRHQHLRGAQSG